MGSVPKVTAQNGHDNGTNDPATTAPEGPPLMPERAGLLVEVDMHRPPATHLRTAPLAPRPNVADQLERFTSRFDELIHRARLATSTADFDDLEEMATEIGRDLRAVFRSPTPRAAPLYVTADGNGAMF